jgi:hypothetical protein
MVGRLRRLDVMVKHWGNLIGVSRAGTLVLGWQAYLGHGMGWAVGRANCNANEP